MPELVLSIPTFDFAVYKLKWLIMKKFFVTYHMTPEAAAEAAGSEMTEEGMKPWMEWAARCGDQLVDMGTPLFGGQRLSPDGGSVPSATGVAGYSIVQAETMDQAKALFEGHPHLNWRQDCTIEVHESMDIPGM